MSNDSQWDTWRKALAGEKIEWERDRPPAGFWRMGTTRGMEAIAVWYSEDDQIHYTRSIFRADKYASTGAEIGELLSPAFRYPIPHQLFLEVTKEGKPFPAEYATRLSRKEIEAGVPWTLELSRAKLGKDVDPATEAVSHVASRIAELQDHIAGIGHNEPPPDAVLSERIKTLAGRVKQWLIDLGGKIHTKAEADVLANYASKFSEFKASADTCHKVEKEPHLIAGRAVDARWFPIRDEALAARKRCLALVDEWMNQEQARRQEEARIANEAARKAALAEAKLSGEKPEPIAEVAAEKVTVGTTRTVSQRIRTVWVVEDIKSYAAHLAAMEPPPQDFVEAVEKIANRMKVAAPGIKSEERRSAA